MHKCRVTDRRHPILHILLAASLLHSVESADARTHADGRIDNGKRCNRTERIASDVAGSVKAELLQRVKCRAVRAARAKDRRSLRSICGSLKLQRLSEKLLTKHIGAVLPLYRKELLALAGNAPGLYLLFDDRIQLLNNVERVYLCGKIKDQLLRKRVHKTELEHGRIRHRLSNILIRDTGGDHTDLCVSHLHTVDRHFASVNCHALLAVLHMEMTRLGAAGHHDVLAEILLVRLELTVHAFLKVYKSLRMGKSRCGAKHHRSIVFFAQIIGKLDKLLRLTAVRRLDHGHLRCSRYRAAVLLILARVKARVICSDKHKTAVNSDIGNSVKRVGCYVDTDMFHGRERSRTCHGRTDGNLHCHLLVG